MDNKTKIVVVCGPTASGKTGLALELCRRFSGELVGADSMQVYRGLEIGTAAPTLEEAQGVPLHLTGFLPPETAFSVAEYVQLAQEAMEGIRARGALPVVCGGTGLYIRSLLEGTRFEEQKPPPQLRRALEEEHARLGGEQMLRRLARHDAAHAAKLHPNDAKRILRALEQWELTGKTAAEREEASRAAQAPYAALCLGLAFPQREELYRRIGERADGMLRRGLLAEAQAVFERRNTYKTAAQAIGYKEFFSYFEGNATLEACTDALKQATRNYAKRQLTWFRHMPGVHWLDAGAQDLAEQAARQVRTFLQEP